MPTVKCSAINLCARYLRWNLKDNSGLVVRCEYDAVVTQPGGGKSYFNIRALNELGPKKVCFYGMVLGVQVCIKDLYLDLYLS